MKNNKLDKTQLYSQDGIDMDAALKSYEKTVLETDKPRKFSKKETVLIICICLFAVLVCGTLSTFILFKDDFGGVIVKDVNGKYALAGKKLVTIDNSVLNINTFYEKSVVVFTDSDNNLYLINTSRYKKANSLKPIAENVDGEFFALEKNCVIFKRGSTLNRYKSNKISKISDNVKDVFYCENGSCFLYLTNDNKLYKGGEKSSIQIGSAVETVDFHSDSKNMNVIFKDKDSISFCDENGNVTSLGNNYQKWFCGEQNEVWDNIYFLKKSDGKRSANIEFTDKFFESDSKMKEPVSSDYEKSIIFGLIQYVDPVEYKNAYIEYQKKLKRDKIRQYANNLKNDDGCFDVVCLNEGKMQTVAEGVFENELLAFSHYGKAEVIINDLSSTTLSVEIADIASQAIRFESQEQFDEFILKNASSSQCIIKTADSENSFKLDELTRSDDLFFSENCEAVLVKNQDMFALKRIEANGVKILFENEKISSYFFKEDKFFFTNETGEFFCVDFLNDNKTLIATDVTKIENVFGKFISYTTTTGVEHNMKTVCRTSDLSPVIKDCADFLIISDDFYCYVFGDDYISCYFRNNSYSFKGATRIIK